MQQWRAGSRVGDEYDRVVSELMLDRTEGKNILVSLQFGVSHEQALKPLLQAMLLAPSCWRWWLRLHPNMLDQRERVRELFMSNGEVEIEIDQATELPLYALLRHVDVHLTQGSNTVVEAEFFGVPSVITTDSGADFFAQQLASGWAKAAYEPADIVNAIHFQLEAGAELRKLRSSAEVPSDRALEYLSFLARGRES